jgi:large subunit ribosomal protein L17
MRHLVKGRKLGRTKSHRAATLGALSVALIKEHRIVTTLAKAKALRPFVEPLITKAKEDSTHNRRQVFSKLKDKKAVSKLFGEIADKS